MTPTVPSPDTVSILCPLGVRFWDSVTETVISDGLMVTAYPPAQPRMRTAGAPNRSGVFAFHGLPGLRAAERGSGDDAFWASPPATREFVVEVVDSRRRFQPFRFTADAPWRGLFQPACAMAISPLTDSWVSLFSAPARSGFAAMAEVRVEIQDTSGSPAAWALVEAEVASATYRGFADEMGRAVLFFPCPEPEGFRISSPVVSGGTPVGDYEWPLRLRVFYQPRIPVPAIPDLCEVLNQPEQLAPLPAQRLRDGRPLHLQLLVTPAVSPLAGD